MIINIAGSGLILAVLSICLFGAKPASSQHSSFLGLKDYFVIKELKTFNEAFILCNSRDEQLVEIRSQAEQEYVYNTIVKPAEVSTWLGARNDVGTATFKWVGDGGRHLNCYSNWETGEPSNNVSQSNAVVMSCYDEGKWHDGSVDSNRYVLCERTPFALQSKLMEQSDQFNGSLSLLNTSMQAVISNSSYSFRNELFNLISNVSDRQYDFERELKSLANDMFTETTFQKRQIKQLAVKFSATVQDATKLAYQVEDQLKAVISSTASTLRGELIKVISEERDKQEEVNTKLDGEFNLLHDEVNKINLNISQLTDQTKRLESLSWLQAVFSYFDKEYFVLNELVTFDDAIAACIKRNASIIEIRSEAENAFIYNTIVKRLDQHIWSGSRNTNRKIISKWMGDCSETNYNQLVDIPDNDSSSELNGTIMDKHFGYWVVSRTTDTAYCLCERPIFFSPISLII